MADHRVAVAQRVLLAVLAVTGAGIGGWAAFAPRAFYDKFPGLGQTWVSVDGPYNEHLVRDFGSLNLALAVVAVCAIVTLSRSTVVATALAWLVYGVPHLVYHARHLGPFDASQSVAVLGGIAANSLFALVILYLERARVSPFSPQRASGASGATSSGS
jgi:hypothetical protein